MTDAAQIEMNEDQGSRPEQTEPPVEATSLFGRLFNVFAAPGEVFNELRQAQLAHSNWVVPVLLSIMAGVLFSVVVFSQPDIVAGVFAQQESAITAQVESGKMSQEQADKTLAAMRQFQSGKMMMIFGSLGAVFATGILFVVLSLMMWVLTSKILKGDVTVLKTVEMVGLASMINVLGSLLTMMIVLLKGNILAGPNAALIVGTFDQANYLHQFLSALSLVTIW